MVYTSLLHRIEHSSVQPRKTCVKFLTHKTCANVWHKNLNQVSFTPIRQVLANVYWGRILGFGLYIPYCITAARWKDRPTDLA